MTKEVKIRASSTSSYYDCRRRVAAEVFRKDITEAGYDLRDGMPNSIGAAIGTGAHAAAEYTLTNKKDMGELGSDSESEDRAIEALRLEVQDGVFYDKVSQNLNDAEGQVRRKNKKFRESVAPNVQPVEVEIYMEAEFQPQTVIDDLELKFILTGHADWLESDTLSDLKTGKFVRHNGPQYGCYSMLAGALGMEVMRIHEWSLPTVELIKPEPEPKIHQYDAEQSKMEAWSVLEDMASDFSNFLKTQQRFAFSPNPNSLLCNPKYCRAYGTNFCKEHK